MQAYNSQQIEQQVQKYWEDNQSFNVIEDEGKEKYYCLSMFPYPSGQLHMGHIRNYTIGDAISRFMRACGKNVLQPIGWDAFGLPAENAALKNQKSPATWTDNNILQMKAQLKRLGFAYDWSRELTTCNPEYYRWEQWLFVRLFNKGKIYQKQSLVNWDPIDNTVLANEQVIDGRGWRSGAMVVKKEIPQWFMRITNYADELLAGLDKLNGWSDTVKAMQRNWIGYSEGLEINFPCKYYNNLTVFTTRPDTLMGVTYLAIAPEHPLAKQVATNNKTVAQFLIECQKTTTNEATLETITKKGIDTGLVCTHPISNQTLPIWVANFVLMSYGSGAVMSVPAHDQRDYEFAKKCNLPIKMVIKPKNVSVNISGNAYVEKGILFNSGQFDGLDFENSFRAIEKALTTKKLGQKKINYRLRDWGISRQRYWGCPIPIIYCDNCGTLPVPEMDLPVILPKNIQLNKVQSPLQNLTSFINTTCPKCKQQAKRETDTFDTFFESSWYFARFSCVDNKKKMLDERANYWLPVDQYVGGIEHAILHLLYARFFNKLMRDEGLLKNDEPFTNLLTQGMVLKDGAKMSKSRGNITNPNAMIEKYGADTVRLFILFAAPPTQDLEWIDSGLEGAHRFINRLYRISNEHIALFKQQSLLPINTIKNQLNKEQKDLRRLSHNTLKKVIDDISRRHTFNTAIAAIMSLSNALQKTQATTTNWLNVKKEALEIILLCLAPITPHICHYLWQQLEHKTTIIDTPLPKVDESALSTNQQQIVVQVSGKLRAKMIVNHNTDNKELEKLALRQSNVKKFTQNKTIIRVIIVPNKLVNIVIK